MSSTLRGNFSDDKDRVLHATDIVRLISEHVTLNKKGREWACVCPFHDDHNPSMYVVPSKQIYHCFVCGAGGDAIKFVRDYHKMSFVEALQFLADRAGIKLTPRAPRSGGGLELPEGVEVGPEVSREDLARANRLALDFYRAILKHPDHGKAGRAILEKRGVSAETCERFQIGVAPDRWDGLAMFLSAKRVDVRPFLAAGLIRNRENGGGAFDMQRNRLIFPIFDQLGRVIAFGGRRINDQDEPKYINSTDSALFSKSSTLYALHLAGETIRAEKTAIVVEGYMDVIACHQAGVRNVVATLGTALTAQSARILSRLCDKVVLFFDGDDAGQRAADRAVEVLFASTLEVRIATMAGARQAGLTNAKDPDELVKQEGGVALLKRIINEATDALEYRFARLKSRLVGASMSQRSTVVEEEVRRLAELGLSAISPVKKQMIVKRVGELAGVGEEAIRRALAETRLGVRSARAAEGIETSGGAANGSAGAAVFQPTSEAEKLLRFVVAEPGLFKQLSATQRAAVCGVGIGSNLGGSVGRLVGAMAAVLADLPRDSDGGMVDRALRSMDEDGAEELRSGMIGAINRDYSGDEARMLADFQTTALRAEAEHLKTLAKDPTLPLMRKVQHEREARAVEAKIKGLGQVGVVASGGGVGGGMGGGSLGGGAVAPGRGPD
ncbi:MAG: DNA primase [Phycisphaerales bacterium]|nr:DNA primase [Phycisphaerales bacterium]